MLTSLVPLSYGITVTVKSMNLDGPALQAARDAMAGGNSDASMRELLSKRRAQAVAELEAIKGTSP